MDRRTMIYQGRTALRRRGLDIGRTNPDCPPYTFLDLVIYPALGINCVIDVGASRGEFGQHLRDYGYTGRIVSFEPVSGSYQVLRQRAEADGAWTVYQYALGDRDEMGEIHLTHGSFWPSLLTPSSYGTREFAPDIEVVGTETVQIRRLDALFEECVRGLTNPRVYLKLDTQGYDRQVLLGAEQSLPRIPALQTELSFQQEYEGMTPFDEMIGFLAGHGYALSGIFKVFRDRHLRLSEADGVFVRPGAMPS